MTTKNSHIKKDKYFYRREFLAAFIESVIVNAQEKSFSPHTIKENYSSEPTKSESIKEFEQSKRVIPVLSVKPEKSVTAPENPKPIASEEKSNLHHKRLDPIVPLTKKNIKGEQKPILTEELEIALRPEKHFSQFPDPKHHIKPTKPKNEPQKNEIKGSDQLYFGRLTNLLNDQNVQSVECPGPDKEVLVRIAGSTKMTRIKLSSEEINEIITSFSRKSKIPIMEGSLKAAIGNLIMTAVVSEMIGSRFVIQKKNPFQPLKPFGSSSNF